MIDIKDLTLGDYNQVINLWSSAEGVGLSAADDKMNIARYLERNPGLSFIALDSGQLIGAVLCGHDGRRGYIHHLTVAQSHRYQGIGEALVDRCLTALLTAGIDKCHLLVFTKNRDAQVFWQRVGWSHRTDLVVMSSYTHDFKQQEKL